MGDAGSLRREKRGERLNLYLPPETVRTLRVFCALTRRSMSDVVTVAVQELLATIPIPRPYTPPKPLPYKETAKYSAEGKRSLARLAKSRRVGARKAMGKLEGVGRVR